MEYRGSTDVTSQEMNVNVTVATVLLQGQLSKLVKVLERLVWSTEPPERFVVGRKT